ncbi:YwdI family protein [Jeotgalibacillus sp. R-1-5s-1]|uniref:YwdI family protein n=1 Tax=Jeotgalibacillus sp. R-1-5s-1 TaxID=2555897 RepID=UPI00106A34B8|nr:YwdI family protein [Jeotgalibacillus sp. R-1-5s-1]TFD92887.1 hypothetical protein E2491_15110 [Jeotgalibacillus sp. R-1-5s-1]
MSISYDRLLQKIEQEAKKARGASGARQREYLHSIRTLCDLALEEGVSPVSEPAVQTTSYQDPSKPAQLSLQDKPLETEDGSNGDSLFDF